MSSFPNSPRLVKGGIALIDPESAQVRRVVAQRYNSDTLTRCRRKRIPDYVEGSTHLTRNAPKTYYLTPQNFDLHIHLVCDQRGSKCPDLLKFGVSICNRYAVSIYIRQ